MKLKLEMGELIPSFFEPSGNTRVLNKGFDGYTGQSTSHSGFESGYRIFSYEPPPPALFYFQNFKVWHLKEGRRVKGGGTYF